MCLRRRSKSPANGVLLDIPNTVLEFLLVHDLALVETACPHIQLALQAKGEASLDELHGLLERNIRSGCNESVEMVRHDDKCVQKESSLAAIFEDGSLKEFSRGCDLKQAAALGRHSGNEIRSSFLWREPHLASINERPMAKAIIV